MWRYLLLGFAMSLCVSSLLAQASRAGQEGKRRTSPERIQKLINACITGSPVVRPQAAERLLKMGELAQPLVLQRLEEAGHVFESDAWFDLGQDFLQVAATMAPPMGSDLVASEGGAIDLRGRLWAAVGDLDFPWRAAIVKGLGAEAPKEEWGRFKPLAGDPMPMVRLASLAGLQQFGSAEQNLVLQAFQAETDDRVKRAFAKRLIQLNYLKAAWYLRDEMQRADFYFDQPSGLVARLEAAQFIKQALPDAPNLDGSLEPDSASAVEQRSALEAYLTGLVGESTEYQAPSLVRKGSVAVIGLELRSCRHGEFFLRWSDADQLWIGRGVLTVVDLPMGTTKRLLKNAVAGRKLMGDQFLTGIAGCDLEGYHILAPGEKRASRFLVSKGPKPIPGLRPNPFMFLAPELVLSLPEGPHANPQVDALRSRIKVVMESVGGELVKVSQKKSDRSLPRK